MDRVADRGLAIVWISRTSIDAREGGCIGGSRVQSSTTLLPAHRCYRIGSILPSRRLTPSTAPKYEPQIDITKDKNNGGGGCSTQQQESRFVLSNLTRAVVSQYSAVFEHKCFPCSLSTTWMGGVDFLIIHFVVATSKGGTRPVHSIDFQFSRVGAQVATAVG